MKHRSSSQLGMPIQFLWGILGFLSVLMIVFFEYQKGTSLADTLKLCILSLVLISIMVFFILSQNMKVKDILFFNPILIGSYVVSLVLILITKGKVEIHVWMIGSLVIAMLFDMYLGYVFTYNLIFFASLVGELSIESIIYLFILGTIMCMLSNYMKKLSTVSYVIIIVLSIQIIFLFIINNFVILDTINVNAVYSVLSSLAVIGISCGGYYIYQKKVINGFKQQEQLIGIPNPSSTYEDYTCFEQQEESIGTHNWDEILDLDFPLVQRLKQYSVKLYNHSLLISELSGRAAKDIGANEQKAKAGGLYHEIGRIENKQYVEEGVKLVEAYHLPIMITDIIRQHNLKFEKPKTPEAAIVMITVSVITTKEYLEKIATDTTSESNTVANVSIEKIVDNVFQMRLSKGSLDESGLTLQQYSKLKDFYLHM